MIAEVDANRNGKIDLEEFYILMGRKYDNNDKEAEMRAGNQVQDHYLIRQLLRESQLFLDSFSNWCSKIALWLAESAI